MSKWKCGICGSEFENYHAQGFDDIIYCPLCYFKEIYKREQKKTKLLQNQLQQKDKEIERLNNIINELEKDFERKIQSCTIEAETTTNDFYCKLHIATLKKWLNRVKELKGSDKE